MANSTDKSILTAAGKALLAQLNAEEKALVIDKMIFANVPNRPEYPQPDDVVPTDHIVHQEQVEQRGRLSADSVIYSTTLTSDVGPFDFNWTGAYCSEYGVLVTIDHHALTPKTADEPGVAGNTLVRSVVLEYKDIAEITNITVDASSWQYNATERMKKMDSDVAQSIIDQNGKDWFIEDGFLVTLSGSAYSIKAGAGYVSGNRVAMEFDRSVQVPNKPSFIYIDAHREGTPTGEQVTLFNFVVTAEEKDDYIDSSTGKDVKHFVCKIAQVLADGSVVEMRKTKKTPTDEINLSDYVESGVADDVAFMTAMQDGKKKNKVLNIDVKVNLTKPTTLVGNIKASKIHPITLIKDIAGLDFITLGVGLTLAGCLFVDVSKAKCNNPVMCDGKLEYSPKDAPMAEDIEILGAGHNDTTGGFGLVAKGAGPTGRSFVQWVNIRKVWIRDCYYAVLAETEDSEEFNKRWINANVISNLSALGCKKYITFKSGINTEISSNSIPNYTLQYGVINGSAPISGIQMEGAVRANNILGCIYDWQYVIDFPVISLGEDTHNNTITHSAPTARVRDLGFRNNLTSSSDNALFNVWISQFENNYLGNQDNILSHFIGKTGTVSVKKMVEGSGNVVAISGEVESVFKENTDILSLQYSIPNESNDSAKYIFELTPMSSRPMGVNGVYIKCEEGFTPDSVRVEIDDGSGVYRAAADIANIENSDIFLKFDAIFDNGDLVSSVRKMKIQFQAFSNKQVRIRQICANGNYPTTYLSRGGGRMLGDSLFEDHSCGPVLTSENGTQYRVVVSDDGVLSAKEVGSTLKVTWF
ncbi:phage tail protein [Vibrio diabolicus]|uniref:phage tail protein n=1 Tax=Vibrio diabolicus TaxID=50719 RepID=UPI00215ECE9A|nr:phage tail protein [Vibrio diabolicus]MCS0450021.1 phage tail protein [Vibrio diabolicus]